jgi:hypothetical protein
MNGPRKRPYSYGGERRAREYVTLLLQTAKAGTPGMPVYLTASPAIASDPDRWIDVIRVLRGFIPGIPFRHWPLIAGDVPSGTPGVRADWIVNQHAGNILIAEKHGDSLSVGVIALLESTKFDAAGKPVLVFTGTRLIAWPDCHVRKIPPGKRENPHIAATVSLPARPDRPLPTLAASFHVLGIRDPDIISRAAGIRSTVDSTTNRAGRAGPDAPRPAVSPRFRA